MADQHRADATTAVPRSRALSVVETSRLGGEDRPEAVFLAQLIACEQRLPAYRHARKAEPSAAKLAYAGQASASRARLDCLI